MESFSPVLHRRLFSRSRCPPQYQSVPFSDDFDCHTACISTQILVALINNFKVPLFFLENSIKVLYKWQTSVWIVNKFTNVQNVFRYFKRCSICKTVSFWLIFRKIFEIRRIKYTLFFSLKYVRRMKEKLFFFFFNKMRMKRNIFGDRSLS